MSTVATKQRSQAIFSCLTTEWQSLCDLSGQAYNQYKRLFKNPPSLDVVSSTIRHHAKTFSLDLESKKERDDEGKLRVYYRLPPIFSLPHLVDIESYVEERRRTLSL